MFIGSIYFYMCEYIIYTYYINKYNLYILYMCVCIYIYVCVYVFN